MQHRPSISCKPKFTLSTRLAKLAKMPAKDDEAFYKILDSIAATTGEEDAVAQNKRLKEAEFAEDSREPNVEEVAALRAYVLEERRREEEARQLKEGRAHPPQEKGPENTGASDAIEKKLGSLPATKKGLLDDVPAIQLEGRHQGNSGSPSQFTTSKVEHSMDPKTNVVHKEDGGQSKEHHHHPVFSFPHHIHHSK